MFMDSFLGHTVGQIPLGAVYVESILSRLGQLATVRVAKYYVSIIAQFSDDADVPLGDNPKGKPALQGDCLMHCLHLQIY